MNTKEKELLGAINGTERMSGYDGEGDMSFFDGDDYDSFDGDDMSFFEGDESMSFASGKQGQAVSDPYIVQYENTTSGTLTAILFGYNDYLGQGSYNGNPTGIVVTNVQGGTYTSLVNQSNNKPFKITTWRFQCSSANQLAVSLSLTSRDANGNAQTAVLNLSTARDPYQQQSDILEVVRPLIVDAMTIITFPLLAGSILTITMFPTAVVSSRSRLKGGSGFASARVPKTSGRNVSPVIIQTQQGVGGIRKR
jgi:hypothetical protein